MAQAFSFHLDYFSAGGSSSDHAEDALVAQWNDIWEASRASSSKAQFFGAMQKLRSRHMARLAKELKQRGGVQAPVIDGWVW